MSSVGKLSKGVQWQMKIERKKKFLARANLKKNPIMLSRLGGLEDTSIKSTMSLQTFRNAQAVFLPYFIEKMFLRKWNTKYHDNWKTQLLKA